MSPLTQPSSDSEEACHNATALFINTGMQSNITPDAPYSPDSEHGGSTYWNEFTTLGDVQDTEDLAGDPTPGETADRPDNINTSDHPLAVVPDYTVPARPPISLDRIGQDLLAAFSAMHELLPNHAPLLIPAAIVFGSQIQGETRYGVYRHVDLPSSISLSPSVSQIIGALQLLDSFRESSTSILSASGYHLGYCTVPSPETGSEFHVIGPLPLSSDDQQVACLPCDRTVAGTQEFYQRYSLAEERELFWLEVRPIMNTPSVPPTSGRTATATSPIPEAVLAYLDARFPDEKAYAIRLQTSPAVYGTAYTNIQLSGSQQYYSPVSAHFPPVPSPQYASYPPESHPQSWARVSNPPTSGQYVWQGPGIPPQSVPGNSLRRSGLYLSLSPHSWSPTSDYMDHASEGGGSKEV
ncbi:hypothetical protein PUNSTDRAFT_131799 [Punctularia strigosozonata HHB-11173 SS5]|uniref:uncharacterized protein n=1 Tax=Punctularia strigosozonata (strain HHB-11173) TaxID=741275 RepID=UPI0004417F96|nr:uncharacterized protein PUNSTDRAFT_131799 [Punctularia strigosozonata HHB-11173 SS5]EIN11640.1 hypothetical protein PUNSTDRAFT_131799 [Punctularia strigosozonata HHB-11173 SS5]